MFIVGHDSINMTYRGVEICLARSCKHQQNRVAFFLVFFLLFSLFFSYFSCLQQPNLRSPSYVIIIPVHANILLLDVYLRLVLVVLVFSIDIGTELVTIESTIETTRRGGSSRYRRCRCCTLLYLPCIFRLRTGSPQPFVY